MTKFYGRAWGYLAGPVQQVEAGSLEEAEKIADVKPVFPQPWPEFFHDEWQWYFRHPNSQVEIRDGVFEVGSYTLVEVEARGLGENGFNSYEEAVDAIESLVSDKSSSALPESWIEAGFEMPGWEDTEVLETR